MKTLPPCEHCGGLGWYALDVPLDYPGFGKPQRCVCMRARDARRIYERAKRASDLDDEMLRSMTFATFDASVERSALDARSALDTWADDPQGWQVLVGPAGRGKTHLLVAAAGALLNRDVAAVYVVAPDLLQRLRDSMHEPQRRDAVKLDYLRQVSVLLLDDFGAENDTVWADEQFYRMLDYRYRCKLPTAIASNLDVRDWPYRLASRAQDRAHSAVHVLTGPDYRLTRERVTSTATRAAATTTRTRRATANTHPNTTRQERG